MSTFALLVVGGTPEDDPRKGWKQVIKQLLTQ
jgi:hypothetical protein